MIIVEGPDGAGKTTLCLKLEKQFAEQGVELMNWEKTLGVSRDDLKEDPARRYYLSLREAFGPCIFIHDRLYFSSLVYGPLMQGNIQMSEEDRKTIARAILSLACPIIVCMPPKAVVVENVRGEGHQMEGVSGIIEDIYDGYLELFSKSNFPFVMYYDYTGSGTPAAASDHSYEALVVRVQHYLDRRYQRTM